jgi:hypothetical protein
LGIDRRVPTIQFEQKNAGIETRTFGPLGINLPWFPRVSLLTPSPENQREQGKCMMPRPSRISVMSAVRQWRQQSTSRILFLLTWAMPWLIYAATR